MASGASEVSSRAETWAGPLIPLFRSRRARRRRYRAINYKQCTTNGCGSQPVDCAGSWGGYGSCYHDNGDLDIGTYMRAGSMAHGSAGSFFGSHYSNTAMQAYWLRPFPGVPSPPAAAAPAVTTLSPRKTARNSHCFALNRYKFRANSSYQEQRRTLAAIFCEPTSQRLY